MLSERGAFFVAEIVSVFVAKGCFCKMFLCGTADKDNNFYTI